MKTYTAALGLAFARFTAAQAPNSETRRQTSYLSTFDDLDAVTAVPSPVGPYNGLDFDDIGMPTCYRLSCLGE